MNFSLLTESSLGGVCAVNYDSCFTPNAVCTNSLCECGSGYVRQGSNCVQRTTGKLPTVCMTVGLAMYVKDQTVFREQLVSYRDCGFGYVRQSSNCVQRTTGKLP